MVINRGENWRTNLPEPTGSGPGFRRLVLIIQSDKFNHSRINTAVILIVSTNLNSVNSEGNVMLTAKQSGLPKNSVVNVSQLFTIDESLLLEYVESLSERKIEQIDKGLRLVLDL